MAEKKSKYTTKQLAMIGLMTALVFVGSKIEIRIPSVLGVTRFHLGNGFALLAGFLMGPVPGGIAAALGSLFYDVVFYGGNPVSWAVTFALKFVMGFFAGLFKVKFAKTGMKLNANLILSGLIGEAAYIAGYIFKKFVQYRIIMGSPMEAVKITMIESFMTSSVNAVIAVIISVLLYKVLTPILNRSGLAYEN